MGIAFDGDGDRLALVDEQGVGQPGGNGLGPVAEYMGRKLCGQPIVCDRQLSDRAVEMVRRFGADPLV